MKAAIVETPGTSPRYGDFPEPEPGTGEIVITVRAAPLSPIVRALVAGTHYTSQTVQRFVPGVDGVGDDPTGKRVYFLFPKGPFGSMAERSLASTETVVPVPDALSDEGAAAIATCGLASWIALTRRAPLERGQVVLVVGATGGAGAMAVQTARHLGAGQVVAVARDAAKLARIDADAVIPLDGSADDALRERFGKGVDVVLDFLWGDPAIRVLRAATAGRGGRSGEPRVRYVQLGTVAGAEIPIRGDMLRSSGLELIGSGIGSVPMKELVAGAGELLAVAPDAGFHSPHESLQLSDVARAWEPDSGIRRVLVPRVDE
jgi:NADPH:quinone reductase-like Zn-dependent oxidoreductase